MNRLDYAKEKPEFVARLRAITREQEQFLLNPKLRALVELRVSQINGCAYCVDLHSRDARTLGENQQRLDSLTVWKESPFFDMREKAALAWAESLTLLPQSGTCDADYHAVCVSFSSTEVVELSLAVSLANFWNRMAGGFRRMPNRTISIRAPWDRLAGCVWLARLADKTRWMRQGKLPPDYLMLLGHPRGIVGHFLRHFVLDKDATLEVIAAQPDDSGVEQWFLAQTGVTDTTINTWNDLAPNLGRDGWPGERELAIAIERFYGGTVMESPVETLFDLIRFDENLPLQTQNTYSSTNLPPP
jgi:AhpD family alkylhydroperoxidase